MRTNSSIHFLAIGTFSLASVSLAVPPPLITAPATLDAIASASMGDDPITSTGGVAQGGALAPSPTVASPLSQHIQPGPPLMTITVVNSHTVAVSTTHGRNAGAPSAVSGIFDASSLAIGQTEAFAVPTNWAGRVAVAEAQFGPLTDGRDVSLIEANYDYAGAPYNIAVADVDISYVDAFSVPIVCSCQGAVVTGCNKNLFDLGTCPSLTSGSCLNPLKTDNGATAATAFFAPCAHAAYTYPNDSGANSFGVCQSGQITCCIGTACPADPKQPA